MSAIDRASCTLIVSVIADNGTASARPPATPALAALVPQHSHSIPPRQQFVRLITHHWIAVDISDPLSPRYRIWFQFRRMKRDRWLARLAEICKKTSAASAPVI